MGLWVGLSQAGNSGSLCPFWLSLREVVTLTPKALQCLGCEMGLEAVIAWMPGTSLAGGRVSGVEK